VYPVREEVTSVSDKDNQRAFDLWESPNERVLESQSGTDAHNHSNKQTAEKDNQEYANGFEQTYYCKIARGASFSIPLCCFK
jgi:hypothetical protein